MPSINKLFNLPTGLKIMLYFFQIFGLFTITFNRKLQQLVLVGSKKVSAIIFFIVMALNLAWTTNSLLNFDYESNIASLSFDSIMMTANIFSSIITAFIISIVLFYRRQEVIEISEIIGKIRQYSVFLNSGADQYIKKALSQSIQLLILIIITWSIIITIEFFNINLNVFYLHVLPVIFNSITMNACILQYTSLILFINQVFKILNEVLLKINYQSSTKMTNFQFIITGESNWAVGKIYTLQKLHSLLYELADKVSNLYSLPIFFCISKLFFFLLHTSYLSSNLIIHQDYNRILYSSWYIIDFHLLGILALVILLRLNSSASSVIDSVSNIFIIIIC